MPKQKQEIGAAIQPQAAVQASNIELLSQEDFVMRALRVESNDKCTHVFFFTTLLLLVVVVELLLLLAIE